MDERKQSFLFCRFAQFFPPEKERTPDRTCMAFGFEIGDGWYPLVRDLLLDIEGMARERPSHFLTFEIFQVKEKWGGLRFYYQGYYFDTKVGDDFTTDELYRRVEQAEKESFTICEDCGKEGTLREDLSWISTLCQEHYEEVSSPKSVCCLYPPYQKWAGGDSNTRPPRCQRGIITELDHLP